MTMIVLLTDFGLEGPYIGQVKAVLQREAPGVSVLDLFSDLPPFQPRAAAYLLPAYCRDPFPAGTVFLCVVDPGVGTDRAPIIVEADGQWFVGPDNGLLEMVMRRATALKAWQITWRPDHLSASFHGRDLFAPVAGRLAMGQAPLAVGTPCSVSALRRTDWPDDVAEVVYVDRFGNLMTGLRAATLSPDATLVSGACRIERATTFGAVPDGALFWYENANGLVEVAVNGDRADRRLVITVGGAFEIC